MANVATLTAKMVFDVSGFSTGANKAISLTQGLKTAVGSLAQSMLTGAIQGVAMAGAFSAIHAAASGVQTVLHGIANEAKNGLGLAMAAESAQTQFKVLLGSAQEAKDLMKDINSFALATPFSVAGTTEATKSLMGAGVSQQRMMSTMRMLGEISGGNIETFKGLAVVYGQVIGKGKLLAQDFNQIAERGINMRDVLAKELKIGVSGLAKAMEDGKISAANFHNALHALATGKYAGSLEDGSKTLEGSLNRLKEVRDSFSRDVAIKLSEKWGITTSANDIANFAEGLKMMTPVVVDAFAQMGDAVFTFVDALRIMGRYAPSAADLATGSPMAALGAWSGRLTGAAMFGTGAENINTKRDLQMAAGIVKGIGAMNEANRAPLPESKPMIDLKKMFSGKAILDGIDNYLLHPSTGGSAFSREKLAENLFGGKRFASTLFGDIGNTVSRSAEFARRGFGLDRIDSVKERQPTGALQAGSSEAFSAIIRSMFANDKKKEELAELKAITGAVSKTGKSIVDAIEKQITGVIGLLPG